jgi:hypothetical protein
MQGVAHVPFESFSLILLLSSGSLVAVSYQQMETEHTRIIFEEDDLTYAAAIGVRRRGVEQLAPFLAHTPSVKVPVVITSNTPLRMDTT